MGKTVSVAPIKNGTVIDHIPIGQALKIIHLLNVSQQKHKVIVGLHLTSSSMGHKDLLKIEDRFLSKKEAHDVAVFAPNATINIIEHFKVASKTEAHLPKEVQKILICPNRRCITKHERVDTLFRVEEFKHKIYLRCYFCEKIFERDEIEEYSL